MSVLRNATVSRWRQLITAANRDPAEIAVLGVLAGVSVWVMAWLIGRAAAAHEVWTGVDGLHPSDQLQYMAWIRSAGTGGLIANPFVIHATPRSFLHPGFLISGLVFDAGVAPWFVALLWKPFAVLALFFGVRAYVHRFMPARGTRRAALVLALFFVSTVAFVGSILGVNPADRLYLLGLEVELWPGTWLWGYAFTVLAVAAIPLTLLRYEHDRSRDRIGVLAPLGMMTCSWLQPWQGATLLGVLGVAELCSRVGAGRRPRAIVPLASLAAGVAPLIYYALLSHFDSSWALAGTFNRIGGWPVWAVLATIAPLALPAVAAYGRGPWDFQELAVRAWPIVGLVVYWIMALGHVGTFAIHAFQGLTIPLAILAVLGAQRTLTRTGLTGARVQAVGLIMVAALTIPALVWKLNDAQRSTQSDVNGFPGAPPNPYFITHGEAAALRFLDRTPQSGGVLTSPELGEVVPARTDRHTWVGLPSWTPDYVARSALATSLLDGSMNATAAVRFVRSTGAGYVLSGCGSSARVSILIRPLVDREWRFGCATVLRLRDAT